MGLSRVELAALAAGLLWAVVLPVVLLRPSPVATPPASPPPLLAPTAPSPPGALFERRLFGFGVQDLAETDLPAGAPELIGIAGRIGRDAVALVRGADGRSRTLGVGDATDGWRLDALAIDAAFFTRGAERLRVPLAIAQ